MGTSQSSTSSEGDITISSLFANEYKSKYNSLKAELTETKTRLLDALHESRSAKCDLIDAKTEKEHAERNLLRERLNHEGVIGSFMTEKNELMKQYEQRCSELASLKAKLLEERNKIVIETQKGNNLLQQLEDSKKETFDLKNTLKHQRGKIQAQQNDLNKVSNMLNMEKINHIKFKSAQNAKYERLCTQTHDYQSKTSNLTTDNEALRTSNNQYQAQLLEKDRQIKAIKDDLLKAEDNICDLENVLYVNQMEQKSKEKRSFGNKKQNYMNKDDITFLKELQVTKIMEVFKRIVDLKTRANDIKKRSDHQIEHETRQSYHNQVKKLKDENQAICGKLDNIRLNNGKIETLEKAYITLRMENDDNVNSFLKTVNHTVKGVHTLYHQFTVHFPENFLPSMDRHSNELDKIEGTKFDISYEEEYDLLKQILKELQTEKEVLQAVQESQHLLQ